MANSIVLNTWLHHLLWELTTYTNLVKKPIMILEDD